MSDKDKFVEISTFKGGDLFAIQRKKPRPDRPHWLNLTFAQRTARLAALRGGGIYAIRYHDQLLYIGKYTGAKKVPFAGDVAGERFWKHLEALTMRGRSVGFSEQNYDLVVGMSDGPIVSSLRNYPGPRGTGAVRTYPCKVTFASEHWDAMSSIEDTAETLNAFSFTYGRISEKHFDRVPTYNELKNYIGVIEDDLITELRPRCNVKMSRSNRTYLDGGPAETVWHEFKSVVRAA